MVVTGYFDQVQGNIISDKRTGEVRARLAEAGRMLRSTQGGINLAASRAAIRIVFLLEWRSQ